MILKGELGEWEHSEIASWKSAVPSVLLRRARSWQVWQTRGCVVQLGHQEKHSWLCMCHELAPGVKLLPLLACIPHHPTNAGMGARLRGAAGAAVLAVVEMGVGNGCTRVQGPVPVCSAHSKACCLTRLPGMRPKEMATACVHTNICSPGVQQLTWGFMHTPSEISLPLPTQ